MFLTSSSSHCVLKAEMPRQKTKALATGFGSFVEKNLPPFSRWAKKTLKMCADFQIWRRVPTSQSPFQWCTSLQLQRHSKLQPAVQLSSQGKELLFEFNSSRAIYPSYFIHERVCHDSSNFLHSFDVQASLSDISAEDFKIAVNSTPLAGNSVIVEKWIYWPTHTRSN